jgi:hypothetical protein
MSSPTSRLLYAAEKYGEALRILATDPGEVQMRVYHALHCLVVITPETVPEEIRPDIERIQQELKKFTERRPDNVWKVSSRPRRNQLAAKIAKSVVAIQGRLAEIRAAL